MNYFFSFLDGLLWIYKNTIDFVDWFCTLKIFAEFIYWFKQIFVKSSEFSTYKITSPMNRDNFICLFPIWMLFPNSFSSLIPLTSFFSLLQYCSLPLLTLFFYRFYSKQAVFSAAYFYDIEFLFSTSLILALFQPKFPSTCWISSA